MKRRLDIPETVSSKRNVLVNPLNQRTFSPHYFKILEQRKGLPVWEQKDEFLKLVRAHQTLVLVGETGTVIIEMVLPMEIVEHI